MVAAEARLLWGRVAKRAAASAGPAGCDPLDPLEDLERRLPRSWYSTGTRWLGVPRSSSDSTSRPRKGREDAESDLALTGRIGIAGAARLLFRGGARRCRRLWAAARALSVDEASSLSDAGAW